MEDDLQKKRKTTSKKEKRKTTSKQKYKKKLKTTLLKEMEDDPLKMKNGRRPQKKIKNEDDIKKTLFSIPL